ncbi:MAG: prevent-host-death protein [Treponema sp.]|nr:prevent-host-death protein [Treponema sp.]
MLVFDISDFKKDTAKVFNATKKNEVIIKNNDGSNYKLQPIPKGKSPFDGVPRIKLGITTQEIVEIIRESRAGI